MCEGCAAVHAELEATQARLAKATKNLVHVAERGRDLLGMSPDEFYGSLELDEHKFRELSDRRAAERVRARRLEQKVAQLGWSTSALTVPPLVDAGTVEVASGLGPRQTANLYTSGGSNDVER